MESYIIKGQKDFFCFDYIRTNKNEVVVNVYFIKDGSVYNPVLDVYHLSNTKKNKCFKFPVKFYYKTAEELRYICFGFEDIEKATIVIETLKTNSIENNYISGREYVYDPIFKTEFSFFKRNGEIVII